MMNIHDIELIPTTKEKGVVEGSVSAYLSMCSSDSTEDAPSSSSNGAFDDLSDLISQLPIIHVKKGLSKFYKGKSQSFTSLTNVTCLGDLVKRGSRIKSCRSSQRSNRVYLYSPKTTIFMKATRNSSSHSNTR